MIKIHSKYLDRLNLFKINNPIFWARISNYLLSEEFIEKYHDKLNWSLIFYNKNLSREFIKKYKRKVSLDLFNCLFSDIEK